MLDVMVDLETMGSGPEAAIIAIGAVAFDLATGSIDPGSFYQVVDLESAIAAGGTTDEATKAWWWDQSPEARAVLAAPNVPLREALERFATWMEVMGDPQKTRIWGNGASFDCVILASAYRNTAIPQPWAFRNERCYRTVKALYPNLVVRRVGTHHNALDDARTQAEHLTVLFSHGVRRAG